MNDIEPSISKISHDLNNQLATMRMTIELMQRGEVDSKLQPQLNNIEGCIIRCIEKVRELEQFK